jgi:hypothetical protein
MTAAPRVDLTDLDMWARGVPYGAFARLRAEEPVAWFGEAPPNSGFWSVPRAGERVPWYELPDEPEFRRPKTEQVTDGSGATGA